MNVDLQNPVHLLSEACQAAHLAGDPNAKFCSLTTLDESGFPVSRIVTIREMNAKGIVIYINGQSPKVKQLENNPNYELLFFWPSSLQQFRLRGKHEIFANDKQKSSWSSKPYAGKLYDLFQSFEQAQSSVISSREVYLHRAENLKQKFPSDGNLEMPSEQLSLRFKADYIEFWRASMLDGLHDRKLYRLIETDWHCEILIP